MKAALAQALTQSHFGMVVATILLVVLCLGVGGYYVRRSRSIAGVVPQAALKASAASMALTGVSLHLTYLAWTVLPGFVAAQQGGYEGVTRAMTVLGWLGRADEGLIVGCLLYVPICLGLGLMLAAGSEVALGEASLPTLWRMTLFAFVLTAAMLVLDGWVLWNFWSSFEPLRKQVG